MNEYAKINIGKGIATVLGMLPQKNREVLERRFGIGKYEPETLESIGESYNITRERVRQIQEYGIKKLNSNGSRDILNPIFSAVEKFINSRSGVVREEDLFENMVPMSQKPYLLLTLRLMPGIVYSREASGIKARYAFSKKYLNIVDSFLSKLHASMEKLGDPMSLENLTALARSDMPKELQGANLDAVVSLSSRIQVGPFGEYGLSNWSVIRPRGVRDKAYLVFGREKKPLHFRELSSLIDKHFKGTQFQKSTHPQTVHNELIKDSRFVLIGRGLYALREWGYEEGTVKDVISKIFKESGAPLDKDEILSILLKRRYVKPNTVLLNLQNKKYFKRQSGGKYYLS